jgi:hypothetical protein
VVRANGIRTSERLRVEPGDSVILRLYGPLQPWFDKTWRPGEIEEVQ